MPRSMLITVTLTVLGAAAAAGCSSNNVPAQAMTALQHAGRYELLSLDPSRTTTPPPAVADNFHGWRVLGRTAIQDQPTRKKLNEELRAGARKAGGTMARCFNPRHGIHVVQGEKTYDVVICFECLYVRVFEGEQFIDGFRIAKSSQRVFDEVLRAADDVTYHNAEYGLTFSLPATWQGYSVLSEEWTSIEYQTDLDRTVVVARGPTIILRHSRWKADDPRQDIPILIFTRNQWEADHQEGIFAGGVMYEISHSGRYLFAIHSRYNRDDSVKGWQEADKIVRRNSSPANQ